MRKNLQLQMLGVGESKKEKLPKKNPQKDNNHHVG
jgi:hypothetical protein